MRVLENRDSNLKIGENHEVEPRACSFYVVNHSWKYTKDLGSASNCGQLS